MDRVTDETKQGGRRVTPGRATKPGRESHPQWEREYERHPAEIELLQTIVLKLDELIAAVRDSRS